VQSEEKLYLDDGGNPEATAAGVFTNVYDEEMTLLFQHAVSLFFAV